MNSLPRYESEFSMASPKPVYPKHQSADFVLPAPPPPKNSSREQPKSQARKLIEKAGSPDQAKEAVDAEAREQAAAPITKDDFARRWGFATFLEMFEASKPLGIAGGKKKWLATSLRGGKWLLWNDADMSSAREFDSLEEAQKHARQQPSGGNSEAAKMQA